MNRAELKAVIRKICEGYGATDTEAADGLFGHAQTLLAELDEIGVSEEEACAVALDNIQRAFKEEVPNERGFLWERQ